MTAELIAAVEETIFDLDAEQSVLGSMLLAPDLIGDLGVVAADFWRPAHETLFGLLLEMYRSGHAVDPVTVGAQLTERKLLRQVGGLPYLHTLIASVPTVANAAHYVTIVKDRALRRRLQQAAQRILGLSTTHADDVDDLLAAAQSVLIGLDTLADAGPQLLDDLIQPALDEVEATQGAGMAGLRIPWLDLGHMLNPLRGGQLVIVGARPACGKSIVGLGFAMAAAIDDQLPAVFFSLEMSKSELMIRVISAQGRIPISHLIRGTMDDDEWARVAKVVAKVAGVPLFLDDSPNLTVASIRSKARRLKARGGLALIVVDYLQLMPTGAKAENRQTAVAEMSRGLKLLARELDVPVIALSQLNRSLEGRADKRPTLSDLRESGAIEQDADVVLLLHRDDMYEKESPKAGEMDVIIAKQRQGATGAASLAFQGHYVRAVDLGRPWSHE